MFQHVAVPSSLITRKTNISRGLSTLEVAKSKSGDYHQAILTGSAKKQIKNRVKVSGMVSASVNLMCFRYSTLTLFGVRSPTRRMEWLLQMMDVMYIPTSPLWDEAQTVYCRLQHEKSSDAFLRSVGHTSSRAFCSKTTAVVGICTTIIAEMMASKY